MSQPRLASLRFSFEWQGRACTFSSKRKRRKTHSALSNLAARKCDVLSACWFSSTLLQVAGCCTGWRLRQEGIPAVSLYSRPRPSTRGAREGDVFVSLARSKKQLARCVCRFARDGCPSSGSCQAGPEARTSPAARGLVPKTQTQAVIVVACCKGVRARGWSNSGNERASVAVGNITAQTRKQPLPRSTKYGWGGRGVFPPLFLLRYRFLVAVLCVFAHVSKESNAFPYMRQNV